MTSDVGKVPDTTQRKRRNLTNMTRREKQLEWERMVAINHLLDDFTEYEQRVGDADNVGRNAERKRLLELCREELPYAQEIKVRLIHGEAFGFPIRVNAEMIAISTTMRNTRRTRGEGQNEERANARKKSSEEFVLEIPTTGEEKRTAFLQALLEVIDCHLTPSIFSDSGEKDHYLSANPTSSSTVGTLDSFRRTNHRTLYLFGFEEHRWISLQEFFEFLCCRTKNLWKDWVEALYFDHCATARGSFTVTETSSSSVGNIRSMHFTACTIHEGAIRGLINEHAPKLQSLSISHPNGEYMIPALLTTRRSPALPVGSIQQLILGASHTLLDSCSPRGLASMVHAMQQCSKLQQLRVDDELDMDLTSQLLTSLTSSEQQFWPSMISFQLPNTPLKSMQHVQFMIDYWTRRENSSPPCSLLFFRMNWQQCSKENKLRLLQALLSGRTIRLSDLNTSQILGGSVDDDNPDDGMQALVNELLYFNRYYRPLVVGSGIHTENRDGNAETHDPLAVTTWNLVLPHVLAHAASATPPHDGAGTMFVRATRIRKAAPPTQLYWLLQEVPDWLSSKDRVR